MLDIADHAGRRRSFASLRNSYATIKESMLSSVRVGIPTARKPTRVLFYLPWEFDRLGGVDVVVDRLYKGLPAHGIETLIGIQTWLRKGPREDADGRQFIDINCPATPTDGTFLSWVRYAITLARRLPSLASTLRTQRIDVINCHFPTTHVFPLAVLKLLGLWSGKLVLSFHGSEVKTVDLRSRVWKLISRAADSVTGCSQYLAEQVAASGFRAPQNVHVIYNGIDVDAFTAAADSDALVLPQRFVLAIGNFVELKGQDVLLKAFKLVADEHPDCHLILAGGRDNGRWLANLKTLANQLHIAHRVQFLENVPHEIVPSLLRRASCLAHASWAESFGLVLIEAGAFGLPVVAPYVGGIPEVVQDECGNLYPPGDIQALAGTLRRYLTDEADARIRGERLRQRVRERFSSAAQCAGFSAVLR